MCRELRRAVLADATLFERFSKAPRTLRTTPEGRDVGREPYKRELTCLYLLSSKKIHFFLFPFFLFSFLFLLFFPYRTLVSDVSGFQATGRFSVARNKEGKHKKERDLVWANPKGKGVRLQCYRWFRLQHTPPYNDFGLFVSCRVFDCYGTAPNLT